MQNVKFIGSIFLICFSFVRCCLAVDTIEDSRPRIVGGSNSNVNEWPWQGGLFLLGGNGYSFLCGASLITNGWAVTAAHCTIGYYPIQFRLSFGGYGRQHTESTVQTAYINAIYQHANYSSSSYQNDISLLQLTQNVTLNSYVQVISYPSQGSSAAVGTVCYITGWGATSTESLATILQEAQVPILDSTVCGNWYSVNGITIYSTQVCAGYQTGGIDTCQGDSGGPLACYDSSAASYILHGITSFGIGCALSQKPGVYTRVSEYSDWMLTTMNNAPPPSSSYSLSASALLVLVSTIISNLHIGLSP